MPYSSIASIPSYVDSSKKKQWMKVFNAAYAKAKADGLGDKEAESKAFRIANGVVKKMAENKTKTNETMDKFLNMCAVILNKGKEWEGDDEDGDGDDTELHVESTTEDKHLSSEVLIKAIDKREWIIYGIVMEPTASGELVDNKFVGTIDSVDAQNEFTTEIEIRKAMIGFMEALAKEKFEPHNLNHIKGMELDTAIIENWQAPEDFTMNNELIRKGSWVQGTKIYNKEIRKAIEEGLITGYSIEGEGFKSSISEKSDD